MVANSMSVPPLYGMFATIFIFLPSPLSGAWLRRAPAVPARAATISTIVRVAKARCLRVTRRSFRWRGLADLEGLRHDQDVVWRGEGCDKGRPRCGHGAAEVADAAGDLGPTLGLYQLHGHRDRDRSLGRVEARVHKAELLTHDCGPHRRAVAAYE